MSSPDVDGPSGHVLQVSVSAGGVPKHAVPSAWVGRLGLDGDRHREDTVHGGPMRAVCLFGMEVIERLQAEGHPVEPGGVGENLTTSGIEWSALPAGTRARVGDRLVLELTKPAMPCDTQRPNFRAGRVDRISIRLFPSDSRMYARVVEEGEVRPGDPITLLPFGEGSDVIAQILMDGIDRVEREADLWLWAAAREAGLDVRVLDDGELAAAATPGADDVVYNHADGLRTLPNLLPRVLGHYRRHGVAGALSMATAPWPGAVPVRSMSVHAVAPDRVPAATAPPAITIRHIDPAEGALLLPIISSVGTELGLDADAWCAWVPGLVATRGVHAFVAEDRGRPVACGLLYVHKRTGLLRTGIVVPYRRGQGLQRALIAARAGLASELGCELLASHTLRGGHSERNVVRMGLAPVWSYEVYRFDPTDDPLPDLTERGT